MIAASSAAWLQLMVESRDTGMLKNVCAAAPMP